MHKDYLISQIAQLDSRIAARGDLYDDATVSLQRERRALHERMKTPPALH